MDCQRVDTPLFHENWLQTGNGHHEPLLGEIFSNEANDEGGGRLCQGIGKMASGRERGIYNWILVRMEIVWYLDLDVSCRYQHKIYTSHGHDLQWLAKLK